MTRRYHVRLWEALMERRMYAHRRYFVSEARYFEPWIRTYRRGHNAWRGLRNPLVRP